MVSIQEPKPWLLRKQHWAPGAEERRIRLLPHDLTRDALFYRYAGVWVGNEGDRRLVVSNRRDPSEDVPDVVEYYAAQDADDTLTAEAFRAITVVELHDFHRVCKNARSGHTYHVFEPCEGRWCQRCTLGIPRHFGRQSHWSMSPLGADHLLVELERISRLCASCLTGAIEVAGMSCGACGTVTAAADSREARGDQLAAPCPNCEAIGQSAEALRCVASERGPGCSTPRRLDAAATPWDLELTVRTAGWPRPFFEITAANVALAAIPEELMRPMDFDAFLGHISPQEQARLLRRPNPFGLEEEKRLDALVAQRRG